MTTPALLLEKLRKFMDLALHRTLRERAHFGRATGMSLPQFAILMQLHHRGHCGISDISQRFDITTPAASQLVDKLVQGGMIERSEDPSDRRARQIRLAPRGRSMLERGARESYRWLDQLVSDLSATERDRVIEALSILNEAVQKQEQTA